MVASSAAVAGSVRMPVVMIEALPAELVSAVTASVLSTERATGEEVEEIAAEDLTVVDLQYQGEIVVVHYYLTGFVSKQVEDSAGYAIVKQAAAHLHQAAFEMNMSDYKESVLLIELIV